MTQGIVTEKLAAISRRPDFWLFALLVWILISASRSLGTPWAAAAGTEALRWGFGLILALSLGWFWRQIELAGQFLVTLTGALALAGMAGGETASHSGLVGPYHDHQLFGSALLLLLPFCAVSALSASSAPWRWGGLAAFSAGTLCLLLSQTRSAWVGLAAALLALSWLWLDRPASRPPRLRVVLVPLAVLLFGLLLAWLVAGPTGQQAAMTRRAATLTVLSQDGSWHTRLDLWRGAARIIAAHPASGIGLGRYPGSAWLWTQAAGLLPPLAHPSLSNEAHSFYGQTAAETGLIGLALYLAGLGMFGVLALQRLRESRRRHLGPQDAVLMAALSALAGQGIDALASPSWQFPEVSFFFWTVLGLGLASLRQEQPAPVPYSLRRAGQIALSGSLAVALTAQVLPIGLLTPVEAYDHLASNAFKSVSLNRVACASGGGICFQLLAVYTNGPYDATMDNDAITGYPANFVCYTSTAHTSRCISSFGTGTTRNVLTVSSSEVGKTLQIVGAFQDSSFPSSPFVASKGTYSYPTATLAIVP